MVDREEERTVKKKECKCKYHEITHGAGQERCLACGIPYDRKKAKLHRYLEKMRRKKK
jgi:hypothetical protein